MPVWRIICENELFVCLMIIANFIYKIQTVKFFHNYSLTTKSENTSETRLCQAINFFTILIYNSN